MLINVMIAYIIDLIIGDPRWPTHPVVIIGKLISFLERLLFKIMKKPWTLRVGGVFMAVIVVSVTYLVTWGIIHAITEVNYLLGRGIEIWLIATTLSVKSLAGAAMEIYSLLQANILEEARKKVGWIVGRDTHELDTPQLTRATVETVAENTVDGILSPLFYAFLGGAPLAMAYKAINTLDSMVGYKNEKHRDLGWASARLDDIANFLPARWAGILLVCAAGVLGYKAKRACATIKEDAAKHPSPNGGIPEAAVAGALGIRLGGQNYYGGQVSFRAYMGKAASALEALHIQATVRLMYVSSVLGVLSGVIIGELIIYIF